MAPLTLNMSRVAIVIAVVMTLLAHCCSAQNYHYSNGWYAGGKKRSSGPSATTSARTAATDAGSASGALDIDCGMRPEALALIERIVQEEALRMQKACVASTSSALQEYLESAARKLAGNTKW